MSNNVHPAQYDSTGAEIYPEYNFKGVDYISLIPILVGGIKEQQAQIYEKDSLINDLNDRLTQLENCLSGILPLLCQMSNSIVEPTGEDLQRELLNAINVELRWTENSATGLLELLLNCIPATNAVMHMKQEFDIILLFKIM